MTLQPLQFVLAVLSGWLNERQAHVVDYLREENRLLKQYLRGQRLRLSDDQRRRLAVKGVLLGRKLLAQVATIVTPETLLAWHRKLVGRAMTAGRRSPDRPQSSSDLAAPVEDGEGLKLGLRPYSGARSKTSVTPLRRRRSAASSADSLTSQSRAATLD
jgi:hypothetical protein